MVAHVLALGLQAGEVGPGARLRIALAPADLAARDLGQEALLLLLGAVLQQRRPEHRDAEARQRAARADRRISSAGPWSRPGTGRRRHRPRASRARSSPSRPSPASSVPALRLEGEVAPAPAGVVLRAHRLRISAGQFASSQARVSARKVSRSVIAACLLLFTVLAHFTRTEGKGLCPGSKLAGAFAWTST
jgi:hypothetical protein